MEEHIYNENDVEISSPTDKDPVNQYLYSSSNYEQMVKDYTEHPESFNKPDPKVVFDPEFQAPIIIKQYKAENEIGDSNNSANSVNPLKDDAINIPLVTINNYSVPDNKLEYFKLTYDDFLPKLHLKILDDDNFINSTDNSGLINQIVIAITTEINGYYKKIVLGFYITKSYREKNYILYDAIYNFKTLKSSNMYMIKKDGNNQLNTYNFLSEIAKANKLGFAATDKCESINDEMPRMINSKNYIDFIKEQISFSGNDEAIFDCWIDLYGYLVLVNVFYVMNENVNMYKLLIYNMANMHSVENEGAEVKPFLCYRILTNKELDNFPHNMFFRSKEDIVDNSKIYEDGSLTTNWVLRSPCKENLIESDQIQTVENSIDGIRNTDKYEYENTNFLGIEFNDNNSGTSLLKQKIINKKFFDKIKAKKTKIQLENYNLGLERGTLVYVQFKDYNINIQNANKFQDNETPTREKGNNLDANASGNENPYIPGCYYIDSMEFEYHKKNHKITHYLYLIRSSVALSTTDVKMAESTSSENDNPKISDKS